MDLIAEEANAGKTSLYARYAAKADLFKAVVTQPGSTPPFDEAAPEPSQPLLQRLTTAGYELADVTLTPTSIALMRATLAETSAFPDIAGEGFQIGFDACARHIARALAASTDERALTEAMPTARRFVELALHPLYMHAFFGADLEGLRERARDCVNEIAPLFMDTDGPK